MCSITKNVYDPDVWSLVWHKPQCLCQAHPYPARQSARAPHQPFRKTCWTFQRYYRPQQIFCTTPCAFDLSVIQSKKQIFVQLHGELRKVCGTRWKRNTYITFAIAVMSISIVANKEVWSKELEVAKTSPCELNRQLKSSQITLLVMFKGNFSFIKTYQVGTCSLVIFFPEVRDAGDLSYSHLQFFLSGVTWNLGFVLLLCEHFPACFSETFPWQWIAPTVMSFGLFPSLGFFWPAAGLAHLGKVTSWDQCVQDGSFWVPWWCQVCLGLNLNSQLLAVPSYNFTTGDLFSPLLDTFFVLSWIFYKIFTICFV